MACHKRATTRRTPPIAIILCGGKDAEVVELMDLEPDNIHIGEYWLKLPPKDVLQAKLHKAMIEAKTRLELQTNQWGYWTAF